MITLYLNLSTAAGSLLFLLSFLTCSSSTSSTCLVQQEVTSLNLLLFSRQVKCRKHYIVDVCFWILLNQILVQTTCEYARLYYSVLQMSPCHSRSRSLSWTTTTTTECPWLEIFSIKCHFCPYRFLVPDTPEHPLLGSLGALRMRSSLSRSSTVMAETERSRSWFRKRWRCKVGYRWNFTPTVPTGTKRIVFSLEGPLRANVGRSLPYIL